MIDCADEDLREKTLTTISEYAVRAYSDIANQNPIRYRGYYYDNKTDYYYLQSFHQ